MTFAARWAYSMGISRSKKARSIWGIRVGVSRPPSRLRPIFTASAAERDTFLSRVL